MEKTYKNIFFLSLCVFSLCSFASDVEVRITKLINKDGFEVEYIFKEEITSMTIENAPKDFVLNYWTFKDGAATASVLDGEIKLINPEKKLSIIVDKGFDTSEIRAYPPYLFFEDRTGVYLDYYLPSEIKYKKAEIEKNKEIGFKIISRDVHREEFSSYKILDLKSVDFKKYYFLSAREEKSSKIVNFTVSSILSEKVITPISEKTEKIMDYIGSVFNYNHPYSVEVLIYFDQNRDYLGFEGSALPGQIVLILSGEDFISNSIKYENEVLRTIAHEAVHLWNGHIFSHSKSAHTWLYEGSAEYLSYQLLLSLDMISKDYYDYFYNRDKKSCLKALNEEALGSVDNTPLFFAAYSCGHIIFDVLSFTFDKKDKYKFIKDFLTYSKDGYSLDSLYKLLNKNNHTADFVVTLEKILTSKLESYASVKLLLATKNSD
ncbi:hypothetical protein J8Z24_09640 [Pseudoalteromonas sp. SCSIO 43201]|uniref:M1 family aminopeptidase n=1 Tax=Pseudoalteromonas sp. SCSIO 43201 TaxID=2822842 RepID=UPI0020759A2D|nr:M1 family aminopeptidase [Pseudoalteromonas sp. SCSIO 43201]USD27248.1 hypothetical protein J8Z24_09640 [Pseudoalteromonas sp. SCSIO 43201]